MVRENTKSCINEFRVIDGYKADEPENEKDKMGKMEFDEDDIEILNEIDTSEDDDIEIVDTSELSKMPDIEQMFLNELYKYPLLSSEEQERLCWEKEYDKEAADKLFKHNLRLVVSVAKFYRGCGLDMMELIQEGCIGLLKGIQGFDSSKGFKLTTYVMWWIKRYMKKAIQNTSATIRLPINMYDKRFEVKALREKLKTELDREPTIRELCEITGYTEDCIKSLLNYVDNNSLVSLDSVIPGSDRQDSTFADIIPDEDFRIDKELEQKEVHDILNSMLDKLDERSKMVVELRIGFNGHRIHTLEEVGDMLGITRERVRQIEKKALKKLLIQSRRTKALRGYEKIS